MLRKLKSDTTAATAVEYALIAGLISIVAVGAFVTLGQNQRQSMEKVNTAYEQVN